MTCFIFLNNFRLTATGRVWTRSELQTADVLRRKKNKCRGVGWMPVWWQMSQWHWKWVRSHLATRKKVSCGMILQSLVLSQDQKETLINSFETRELHRKQNEHPFVHKVLNMRFMNWYVCTDKTQEFKKKVQFVIKKIYLSNCIDFIVSFFQYRSKLLNSITKIG